MSWDVEYIPEAETDMDRLDGSQRKMVLKAIDKVAKNPLPVDEGGYGKPLGNKHGNNPLVRNVECFPCIERKIC